MRPHPKQERNDLLRQARLRTPSPSNRTRPMSQRELADAVTAYVQHTTGRDVALSRHEISRWESGKRRRPSAEYRSALRAVLGTATDAELGFHVKRRAGLGPAKAGRDRHLLFRIASWLEGWVRG